MSEIELYKLLTEVSSKFFLNRYHVNYVETEFVISEPKFLIPDCIRIYSTEFYLVDGKVLESKDLPSTSAWKANPGTSNFNQIKLYEYKSDWGDDGHVDYRTTGWIFCDDLKIEKLKQKEINGWISFFVSEDKDKFSRNQIEEARKIAENKNEDLFEAFKKLGYIVDKNHIKKQVDRQVDLNVLNLLNKMINP